MNSKYLNEYFNYSYPTVGQTQSWHYCVALSIASAILNGKVYVKWGRDVYTNLWLLLVGRSGRGKSSISDNGMDLIFELESSMGAGYGKSTMPGYLLPARSSIEALYAKLREHPQGLIFWDDLQSVFKEAREKQYMAGLIENLTRMYTVPQMIPMSFKGEGDTIIYKPCLSILASTPKGFMQSHLGKRKEWEAGYWQRWWYFDEDPTSNFILTPKYPTEKQKSVVRGFLFNLKNTPSGEMQVDKEAWKRLRDYTHSITSNPDADFYSFKIRSANAVLKTGIILACAEGRPSISEEDIEDGITFANWSNNALSEIFPSGDSEFSELKNKTLKMLRNSPDSRLPYAFVLRELGVDDFYFESKIIRTLVKSDLILLDNIDGKQYICLEEK